MPNPISIGNALKEIVLFICKKLRSMNHNAITRDDIKEFQLLNNLRQMLELREVTNYKILNLLLSLSIYYIGAALSLVKGLSSMTIKTKLSFLGFSTLIALIIIIMLKPIPQDLAYHRFADQRNIAGIPNFLNVITNLPFLFVGVYGLFKLKLSAAPAPINRMYAILFAGIFLTGMGSAYYHYAPDNNSLVYDRLPMTLVFMAFLSSVVAAWIDIKAGARLLIPFLLLGTGSVIYWHYTELKGAGDLRFYAFIQFFPMVLIPFIFLLFRDPANNKGLFLLVWVIGWYVTAKLLETFDKGIYTATHFISGHSLKHIAAAVATWYMVKFFERKYIVKPGNSKI